jgi:signal peptidase
MPAARTLAASGSRALESAKQRSLVRIARTAGTVLVWLAIGIAVGLTGALVLPSLFGYKALTVISGSMEPTLEVGSIVLDERIAPLDARPGDIVSFPDPSRGGRLVTHRLQKVRAEGGTAFMVTKGDANTAVERWSVPADGEIGRVVYHVPKIGYVRAFLTGPRARLALLAIALALGVGVLIEVWRRP